MDGDCEGILCNTNVCQAVVLVFSTPYTVPASWPSLGTSARTHNEQWLACLQDWPILKERGLVGVTGNHDLHVVFHDKRHQRPADESHRLVVHTDDFPFCGRSCQSPLKPSLLLLQQIHKPLLANLLIDNLLRLTQVLRTNATMSSVVGILHIGIDHEKFCAEPIEIVFLAVVRGWHFPAIVVNKVLDSVVELSSDV